MEDLVVRKFWQASIIAVGSAVGLAGMTAHGGPFSMLSGKKTAPPAYQQQLASSGESYSWFRHPVQSMSATVSKISVPEKLKWGSKSNSPSPRQTTAENDSISLSTPTGPPTPQLIISVAQMCEQSGDIAQARHHYQHALKLWPGQVDVLRAAARMEDRVGNLQLAENLYQQAANANPQHAGALNDLGLCLARQGKLEASAQTLEQAVHLQPEKALYRNNAATVLAEMRQDHRALAHLAAVHGAAQANYNMGKLLVQRNRAADAVPYLEAALQQDPHMEAAQVELAKLQGQSMSVGPVAAEPTTPVGEPQQAPSVGPPLNYPSTAQGPGFGTSTYVPPAYRVPLTNRVAAPQYLPPVATQPGPVRR